MFSDGNRYDPSKEFPSDVSDVVYKKTTDGTLIATALLTNTRVYVIAAQNRRKYIAIARVLSRGNRFGLWGTVECSNDKILGYLLSAGWRLEQNLTAIERILKNAGLQEKRKVMLRQGVPIIIKPTNGYMQFMIRA